MGRIIGYMANRKDRLGDVLDEEHEAIAPPPDFRPDAWGIGFYQGGEVLHKKRPKLDEGPIDWEKVARGVVGQVGGGPAGGGAGGASGGSGLAGEAD